MTDVPFDPPPLIRPEPGPATCKSAPWAGERLGALKGRDADEPRIAESWEFSTLVGSESRTLGRDLSDVIGCTLPFLAKLIDTAAPLSIQVHPEDDPSIGRVGKEEAWVILDAVEDASLLAGVREGVDDETLESAMRHVIAAPEEEHVLLDLLERRSVERGMIVLVPAGTVHSIGPGILLAEIQQPTDCTYRLFDYGSDREIHPAQARAAWRVDVRPETWRPGEPIRPIRGHHLSLDVWRAGEFRIEEDRMPRLLMAVGEGIRVRAGSADEETIGHAELRLHLHGPLELKVENGATLVTGIIADDEEPSR